MELCFHPEDYVMCTTFRINHSTLLAWQTESKFLINERECKQFTLFLTSHIDPVDTNQSAIEQLENRVIKKYQYQRRVSVCFC